MARTQRIASFQKFHADLAALVRRLEAEIEQLEAPPGSPIAVRRAVVAVESELIDARDEATKAAELLAAFMETFYPLAA